MPLMTIDFAYFRKIIILEREQIINFGIKNFDFFGVLV